MRAVYNEFEPYAAQWLRNLSAANRINPGAVDDRSIKELVASDVAAATQAHFFAGIGAWSYALRLAGWPDDAPVWTGSCPCQPFSVAGKQRGTDDERHLWPEWRRLIAECLPPVVFGEQVASRDGRAWLAAVRADLEALGYVVGAADLCAAGVGAPHIRQRLYFGAIRLADADTSRRGELGRGGLLDGERQALGNDADGCGALRRLGNSDDPRPQGHGQPLRLDGAARRQAEERHGPASGAWGDVKWLRCLDGKSRPTQPGVEPLVDGAPSRVGRLRAYGNAIVPQVAATFIRSFVAACGGVA